MNVGIKWRKGVLYPKKQSWGWSERHLANVRKVISFLGFFSFSWLSQFRSWATVGWKRNGLSFRLPPCLKPSSFFKSQVGHFFKPEANIWPEVQDWDLQEKGDEEDPPGVFTDVLQAIIEIGDTLTGHIRSPPLKVFIWLEDTILAKSSARWRFF